ncbi:MAG: hypothetical protein OEV42_20675, partial [Deltaproteobacteria bacterium]|nr:hypothetical protein [Deltaproteobacteria bacterium]
MLLVDKDVSVRTASITIDYGIHAARQDKYRVAVNSGDGAQGISLAWALQDILGLSISQGPGEWIYGDDPTASITPSGLLAVGTYVMDTSTNRYWLLAHNHTTDVGGGRTTDFYHLLNEGYDLNDIHLMAGDKVTLVYVGDEDRDGLSDRLERDYGTDPNKLDTDDDTLMDAVEIYGWLSNLATPPCDSGDLVRVYSNPLTADSDGDGISDSDEKSQCQNPALDFVAMAGNDDSVNVGSAATLYGSVQSTAPVTPVYHWLLLSGPDVLVGGESTRELSGAQPTFTAPDEVSTLLFELEVRVDGSAMTDYVKVQVQKDRLKAVYVGDPATGAAPNGSAPYSTLNDALIGKPGMDVYVMSKSFPYAVQTVDIPDGVSLFGGYNENWLRDTTYNKTQIVANITQNNQPAVRIESASSEMWFSGFSVVADNNSSSPDNDVIAFKVNGGTSSSPSGQVHISENTIVAFDVISSLSTNPGTSYALLANNLVMLSIEGNTLVSGNGGNGQIGNGGTKGNPGGNSPGTAGGASAFPCDNDIPPDCGKGGNGGAGGTAIPIHWYGYFGQDGHDSATGEKGGAGGIGGRDDGGSPNGEDGNRGGNGTPGLPGRFGEAGSFNYYVLLTEGFEPANGKSGEDGGHGGGGGGGGGGMATLLTAGGAGSGGGGGGQGGTTGEGGGG